MLRKVMVCGLPYSGKSTFIGALWHLLDSGEATTSLEYDALPEDRERLNFLANKWRRCEPMDRTEISDAKLVELKVKMDGEQLSIVLPDASGETWREMWEDRSCNHDILELARESVGVLLFAHVDMIDVPLPVVIATEQAEILDGGNTDASEQRTKAVGKVVPYTPDKAPTQTKLVDILQLLAKPPLASTRARRLAVVLSAWDIAEEEGRDPVKYAETYFPLLYQYLQFSNDYEDVNIYGISALGGNLPQDAEKLRAVTKQSDRIRVVESDHASNDLTRPLAWILRSSD